MLQSSLSNPHLKAHLTNSKLETGGIKKKPIYYDADL